MDFTYIKLFTLFDHSTSHHIGYGITYVLVQLPTNHPITTHSLACGDHLLDHMCVLRYVNVTMHRSSHVDRSMTRAVYFIIRRSLLFFTKLGLHCRIAVSVTNAHDDATYRYVPLNIYTSLINHTDPSLRWPIYE